MNIAKEWDCEEMLLNLSWAPCHLSCNPEWNLSVGFPTFSSCFCLSKSSYPIKEPSKTHSHVQPVSQVWVLRLPVKNQYWKTIESPPPSWTRLGSRLTTRKLTVMMISEAINYGNEGPYPGGSGTTLFYHAGAHETLHCPIWGLKCLVYFHPRA